MEDPTWVSVTFPEMSGLWLGRPTIPPKGRAPVWVPVDGWTLGWVNGTDMSGMAALALHSSLLASLGLPAGPLPSFGLG